MVEIIKNKKGLVVKSVIIIIILLILVVLLVPGFTRTASNFLKHMFPFLEQAIPVDDSLDNSLNPRLKNHTYGFLHLSANRFGDIKNITSAYLSSYKNLPKNIRRGCEANDFPDFIHSGCWIFASRTRVANLPAIHLGTDEIDYTAPNGTHWWDRGKLDHCANFLYNPNDKHISTHRLKSLNSLNLNYFEDKCHAKKSYNCDDDAFIAIKDFFSKTGDVTKDFFNKHSLICVAPKPGRYYWIECSPAINKVSVDNFIGVDTFETFTCNCKNSNVDSCEWK